MNKQLIKQVVKNFALAVLFIVLVFAVFYGPLVMFGIFGTPGTLIYTGILAFIAVSLFAYFQAKEQLGK